MDVVFLFVAAYFAALVSGAAGFGGALLLLPMLVATVGVEQAVPLLTLAQLIGNLSRAGLGLRQICWLPVGWFLLGALPFSLVGARLFVELPGSWATRAIGLMIIAFVALHHFGGMRLENSRRLLVLGGAVVGFLSGLIGSAGPLGAAVFLSLGLPPLAYVASEAVTALAMHGIKTLVYQHFIAFDREFWWLAALIGAAMILGTWSAKRVIERLPRKTFHTLVTVLLLAVATRMVILG